MSIKTGYRVPTLIGRRSLLLTLGAWTLAPLKLSAQSEVGTVLEIGGEEGPSISSRQLGVSYEKSRLAVPWFFSAQNESLIRLFRSLGTGNILRLGGFSSDLGCWSDSASKNCRFSFSEKDLSRLATFLEAVDWNLIYGANLARATDEAVVEEVRAATSILGKRLLLIQLGNEPDIYKKKTKIPEGDINLYKARWVRLATRFKELGIQTALAAPDVAESNAWISEMAELPAVKAITRHYYAVGPANDPSLSYAKLTASFRSRSYSRLQESASIARKLEKPYYLTEVNTCYGGTADGGGRKGLSDTLGAALWGIEFLINAAKDGWGSTCFHSGFKDPNTPIRQFGQIAQPAALYYAQLIFRLFAKGKIKSASFSGNSVKDLECFACGSQISSNILIINRGTSTLPISIPSFKAVADPFLIILQAPRLDSAEIKLNSIALTGTSRKGLTSIATSKSLSDTTSVLIPPYSAMLLTTKSHLESLVGIEILSFE